MQRPTIVLGIRRWVLILSALMVGAAGVGSAVAKWHNRPIMVVQPPPTPPCADLAYIGGFGTTVTCDSRARLEIYPAPSDYTLFKCVCRR